MPSALALFLCTMFVLFMLRLDHKQSPDVSFALWVPTIWMLLISSKPLGIWFGIGGVDLESGSPMDRAFLITLFCLSLLVLVKRNFNWSSAIKENNWLMLLVCFMLVSCLWSDIPFISFKRWSKELIAVTMAFIVATEPHPKKALESLFRRTVYVLIPFSYILIHYFGEYGRLYRSNDGLLMWTGVALHKNSLAHVCLLAIFFLIWSFIKRQQGRDISAVRYRTILESFILVLALWILGGPEHTFTYSATTTVAFVVGLVVFIGLFWKKKRGTITGPKILTALLLFIFIYGTVTPILGRLTIVDISSVLGRNKTLTGRTDIWEQLVPVAMKRPILGYGNGGFWTTTKREKFDIDAAHNGYLEVILVLGFVGLMLYSIFFVSSIRKAQKVMTQDFYWGALWICYLLMVLVNNIAESSLSSLENLMMAVTVFLSVSYTVPATNTQERFLEDFDTSSFPR